MIIQTIDLNLIPSSAPIIVHCDQYDTGTGRILARLYDGDTPYTPSGTAIIQGTKPDRHGFMYNATLSGNTVTADLTEQMTACAGDVRCQIVVTETSGRTGSFAFTLSVQKSALPSDTDMSASDYQIIEELIEDVQEAVGTATQSASDAEAWAVGERGGEPVTPTDPTYQNNAEYWAHYAEEHGSAPVMTGSILGIGSPDDLTTIATNGIITAKGVAISATVNPSGTEHGANWLKHGTTVLTPDSEQMYLVYIDNAPTLWTWDGTAYVQISGGGGPTGSTITVTTTETTLFGEDVILTDGTSTLTETFDSTGTAVFTGVTMTGTLTAESTDGSSTATGTVTVTDPGTYTVQINFWIATINITTDSPDMYGQTITVKNSDNVVIATTTFSNQGTASVTVGSADTYTVSCLTESDNVTVSAQTTYTVNLHLWTATLSISTSDSSLYDEPIDIQRGGTYVGRTTFSNSGTATYNVHDTGTYYVTCQGNTETVTVSAETTYNVTITTLAPIYGAEWDGTLDPAWTRTDAATSFVDPNPYYTGMTGTPSSPFDNISPWKDMVISEDSEAGTLVSIPKFYYKRTQSGSTIKLQISMSQHTGFLVSPAHADRGDGKGERDVVYVGRYHCASDYKSKTGVTPKANETRATFRSGIHNLGNTIWQMDFALFWTISMLYLVEYANWNAQEKIGFGCGNNTAAQNAGASDNMGYHTGTMQSSRTTYGVGVQYRYIEDWWANLRDWCDGIYFDGEDVYCIKNPASFSDSANGTNTGKRSVSGDGLTKGFNNPSVSGYEYALYPNNVDTNDTQTSTYITDNSANISTGKVLFRGAFFSQNPAYGAFYLNGYSDISFATPYLGSRLMKLP